MEDNIVVTVMLLGSGQLMVWLPRRDSTHCCIRPVVVPRETPVRDSPYSKIVFVLSVTPSIQKISLSIEPCLVERIARFCVLSVLFHGSIKIEAPIDMRTIWLNWKSGGRLTEERVTSAFGHI